MKENFGMILIISLFLCTIIAWFIFFAILMAEPTEGSIFEIWYYFLALKGVGIIGLISMSAIIGYMYECIKYNNNK